MAAHRIAALGYALLVTACGHEAPAVAANNDCRLLSAMVGKTIDAGPALQACIDRSPAGGTLSLRPGIYRVATPVRIGREITIGPAGVSRDAPACAARGDTRCPVIQFRIDPAYRPATMPLTITGSGGLLHHIVFAGTRTLDPAASATMCAATAPRQMGGGLNLAADRFGIIRSVFRDFACYTAIEVNRGDAIVIADNKMVDNGTNDRELMWSDGLTVHEATRMTVTGNRFVDNTDVQLIFGGCTDCRIAGNVMRHSGSASGAAFAELMLHAWPTTSGNFTGTVTTANDVDCGAARRCGTGLMIGGNPWYRTPTQGGTVTGNRIANAIVAINVNDLSGPMTIRGNHVIASGGRTTSCDGQPVPAVNVSAASRRFLDDAALETESGVASARDYAGCIIRP